MTDRELLESAAKAAGIKVEWHMGCGDALSYVERNASQRLFWNPLTDDGDALRLAVHLRITPHIDGSMTEAETAPQVDGGFFADAPNGAPSAATRRAIVRAAAAMGQG